MYDGSLPVTLVLSLAIRINRDTGIDSMQYSPHGQGDVPAFVSLDAHMQPSLYWGQQMM